MTTPTTPSPSDSTAPREPSVFEIYFPQKLSGHRATIFVASFPPILYLWPSIVWLLLASCLQALGMSPHLVGWFTVLIVTFNLIVFVQDFDQKQFLILVLVLLAALLGVWILQLYGITFISSFASWLVSFSPHISTHALLIMGVMMLLLFIWGMLTPLLDYWRFEQNEFVHYTQPLGRDMSIPRMGCTVFKDIPDIFESILSFGGGSLVIRKDQQILATIPHVPFLGLRMRHIEHMLSETRVVIEKE
ncbi:MAG: hypothetical protein QY326_08740 [Bdellovibrionota bacterium]|nr:MAG: hypothetical protein QY326_08740 [Bdellovibrionota bacterium]